MDLELQSKTEFDHQRYQLLMNQDSKASYITGYDHTKMEDFRKSTRRQKTQKRRSKPSRAEKNARKSKLEDESCLTLVTTTQYAETNHSNAPLISDDGIGGLLVKQWVFSTNVPPPTTESWVEVKRRLNAEIKGVELFFQDYEDSETLCSLDGVSIFSQGASLGELTHGAGAAGSHRAAWLDSRDLDGGLVREYRNPLTATALYKHLSRDLIGDQRANRVLICIANLDPNFLLALAETAPCNYVEALRDAVRNYLAFQSSLRVFTNRSCSTFGLNLHISYFAVRKSPPTLENHRPTSGQDSTIQWTSLSFLGMPGFSLYKSRFSLIVVGSNDTHWTGYSFVDRDLGENPFEEDDFHYQNDRPHEDPISSDSGFDSIDANVPIWDARAYWLAIGQIRIRKVKQEWEFIIPLLERSIGSYNLQKPAAMSQQKGKTNRASTGEKAYDWVQETMQVIEQLFVTLSQTVKAGEIFLSSRGGISYFVHFGPPELQKHTHMALQNIDHEFEALKSLLDRLISLKDTCQSSAKALDLLLTKESHRVVQHTSVTTEWTISIFTPIALCIAYFSMPETIMSFNPSRTTFFVAMILILVCVRLLFEVSRGPLWETWWWKALTWLVRPGDVNESTPKTSRLGAWLPRIRMRNPRSSADRDPEGIGPDRTDRE